MNEEASETIRGDIVMALREMVNWTQHDLAERSGLTQATVSRLEADKVGRKAGNTLRTLSRLARAFGIPADELYRYAVAGEEVPTGRVLHMQGMARQGPRRIRRRSPGRPRGAVWVKHDGQG